jgi:N,N-dimethylformamidase
VVPLIGYVDRFSARPGERIAVNVSSRLTEPYQADLVRIVHGDANLSERILTTETRTD